MDVDHGFFSNLFEAYNTSAVWKAMDSWYRASETVAVTSWGYALLYYDYIMSLLSNLIDRIPAYPIVKSLISPVTLPQLYAFLCGVCIMCSILVWLKIVPTAFGNKHLSLTASPTSITSTSPSSPPSTSSASPTSPSPTSTSPTSTSRSLTLPNLGTCIYSLYQFSTSIFNTKMKYDCTYTLYLYSIFYQSVLLIQTAVFFPHNVVDERKPQELDPVKESICSLYDVFDLAKTAYEKGHTEAVMKEVESRNLDVNMSVPISGLSLFMCACLSGHRRLIQYMTEQGGDPHCTSTQGDSPLYLATYGILNSPNGKPDFGALDELIDAGCSVNKSNHRGYTPLHRAASKGDLPLVNYLLMKGADPYRCNNSGIYPIDSAVSAGHKEVAQALRIDVANPHVWDVIEPHTPPHISLGLMSPHRRLMLESPAPKLPLMTLR
ncbi:uncharacterized protein LOC135477590 isoform X1 [Liolophura sinensis]|uniref:uncharacterized protein LOC135477590 isoform X1 n=1 Tax=Liolophura sinensis TaxID=3198878 RepID=UPI0031586A0F